MSELGDIFKARKDYIKKQKELYGVDCPECKRLRPKTNPSRLLPGQRCRVDGWVAPEIKGTNQQNP